MNVPVVMDSGANFLDQQGGVTNWTYDGHTLNLQIGILQYSQAHVFEPILAHEYGHVLLIADPNNLSFTGGIGQHRLQEEEGFCEVLRYLWVTQACARTCNNPRLAIWQKEEEESAGNQCCATITTTSTSSCTTCDTSFSSWTSA
jgi:hypothetical protein